MYLLIVYLFNRVFPWLGVIWPMGSHYCGRRARRKLFGASIPFVEGSGRPVSRTVLLSSGQRFSRMQRSRMVRVERTNERGCHPPLVFERRL